MSQTLKKGGTVSTNEATQKVTIFVSPSLHKLMKEYAKRKRINLGLAYDQAMHMFLTKTENYMGIKRQNQLRKG